MGVKSTVPGCWLGETLWISARDGMTQVVQSFPTDEKRAAFAARTLKQAVRVS